MLPVSEGDGQFSLGHFLVAFREQTEELCLEVGLQQTVVLDLVEDEEIILSRTEINQHRDLQNATETRSSKSAMNEA